MSEYSPTLDELRGRVDSTIAGFVAAARDRLALADALFDEITVLIDAGGKRTRPAFCYWGYRSTGAEHGRGIERVAAALELLHTFAIVHDDIMDSSEERRGVPTVHAEEGENVALLVGDLALVLADALFMGSGFSPDAITRAFKSYSRMRQEVIVGQYMDLRLSERELIREDEARLVARMKSGRYTIEEPLLIGTSLAGGPGALSEGLSRFGELLGEAFQLRDDLLGTFGDRAHVGKPVDSDIREGKRNVLYAKTLVSLQQADRDFFVRRWGGGSSLTDADIRRMRRLIESSGARRGTEALLGKLKEEALEELESLAIDGESRRALEDLAHWATVRGL